MQTDFNSLRELHEFYAVNNNCPLKSVATQPVYEINIPKSGIVFIGEAPGKNEDLQGRPFVGAAGKFLNELLGVINLTRDDVYVSNVVKYRPPANRDPSDSEKASCRVWLNAELLFIKPRVIVTLGRHALTKFVPDAVITADHGKIFMHSSGIPIFAMYHPAAALYNPTLKDVLKKDIVKLDESLNSSIEKNSVIDELLDM